MSNGLWREDFVDINKYSRPGTKLLGVKKLVLHWTANPGASAANHKKYFGETLVATNMRKVKDGDNEKLTYASAHIFVDQKEAINIVPLNEMAYHANDVQKRINGVAYRGVPEISPNANKYSIGVEMCVEKDGTISQVVIDKTAQIFAELCRMNKLTEKDIVRHYDVTHKNCPKPFVDDEKLFEAFKAKVGALLNPPKPAEIKAPVKTTAAPKLPTLNLGDKGDTVKELQTKLKLKADGIFGPKTEAAVKKFQKANGLVADGIVGDKTWSKLK
jgi:N-acetylmuramoyl-L-alanine amidase